MTLEEIIQAIESKYDHSDKCCEMFDDICNEIFTLTDSESEQITIKTFLLKVLETERK